MNGDSSSRSLWRPLLTYFGLAIVTIAVSHIVTLQMGVYDIPVMSYGILLGVSCGLSIWIACGQKKWWWRFSTGFVIVLLLGVFAWKLWQKLMPFVLIPGRAFSLSGLDRLSIGQAVWHSCLGFLLVWAPMQVASVWFGWRLDTPALEQPLRDGHRLRLGLLVRIIAVLIIAVIILRIIERAPFDLATTIRYVNYLFLLPMSAIFGLIYVTLVWGWLVATRLRYSIAASIPYGLLFVLFFVTSILSPFRWLIFGPILLHGIFFLSAVFVFRQSGWRLVPYSKAELIRE